MNIRRGFFRIWAVLSALWVFGAIFSSYGEFQTAFERSSAPQAVIDDWVDVPASPGPKPMSHEMSDDEVFNNKHPMQTSLRDQITLSHRVFHVALIGASFPAVTFALWSIMTWIGAGFRDKKQKM